MSGCNYLPSTFRYKEGRQLESVKFRKIINIIFTMKSLILAQDER